MPSTSADAPLGLLAPSATPNHLLLLPLGPSHQPTTLRVRRADALAPATAKWGAVSYLAFDAGNELLALAHSTSKLSLVRLPPASLPSPPLPTADDASPAPKQPSLSVVHEYKTTSTLSRANRTVALELLPAGLLHATSAGHLALHVLPSSPSSDTPLPAPQTRRLPPNLTCFSTLGGGGGGQQQPTHFAYAGQEVDLSVWDLERAFGASPASATAGAGGKRKKGGKQVDLLPGEVWRAQNLPNDHLSLRVPIHHLALCAASPGSTTTLYSGTHDGHVRLYDTRSSRRPVQQHAVLKPFKSGVGALAVDPADDGGDLWFAEDGRGQGRIGRMDARTGRVLYFHSDASASCAALWAGVGRVGAVGADGTVDVFGVPAREEDERKTPVKGGRVVRAFGAAGRGAVGVREDVVGRLATVAEVVGGKDKDGKKAADGGSDADADEDDDEDDDDGETVWATLPALHDGEDAPLLAPGAEAAAESDVDVVVEGESSEEEGWSSEEEKPKKKQAKKGGKKARR